MKNIPEIKLGVIAVSRDCFPIELSRSRHQTLMQELEKDKIKAAGLETIIENEQDTLKALQEIEQKDINTLVIYLGNFGPETPTSMLAQRFKGPVMFCAAGEESGTDLINGRGDAYCGMLNMSYNLDLRKQAVYMPEYPVGSAAEIKNMIKDFIPAARTWLGVKNLKIFSFGPRPQDFLACNAPIKALYDMGVEIMENSELDLYDLYMNAANDPEIPRIKKEMADELGSGNTYPDLLDKLARYEAALVKFYHENLGAASYAAFANKCWPAFESYFGFVPCFVNSRLACRGIPVACETDIYGALSEYMATCATEKPATLLDINNTVPADLYAANKKVIGNYKKEELFMGFHCGNTCSECLVSGKINHQVIMHRLMEPGKKPDITRGTLEGNMRPGAVTLFRLQSTADTVLKSYLAQGEILDMDCKSFGSIGTFAVKDMDRFYRHILLAQRFPHHAGIAFAHAGKTLFSALQMLGVENIYYNQPASLPYKTENPFA